MVSKLQEIYKTSSEIVRSGEIDEISAWELYKDYVRFVVRFSKPGDRILDVGCGNGWSSYFLSKFGLFVTGMDLNPSAFTPQPGTNLKFTSGSVLEIPFSENDFDIVCANQMLEHVPDPKKALMEMIRVVKGEGMVCIVSPNLLSPVLALYGIVFYCFRTRPLSAIFVRRPGTPRHPTGNTLPENLFYLARNSIDSLTYMFRSQAAFPMREPDLTPPFHADNDACYLCNPFDLVRFFRTRGDSVVRNGKPGRLSLLAGLAGGTWLAARKKK